MFSSAQVHKAGVLVSLAQVKESWILGLGQYVFFSTGSGQCVFFSTGHND